MPIDRTTILRGPAIVTFDNTTYYSKGDIVVEIGVTTFAIENSAFGKTDERVDDRICKVRFTPDGQIDGDGHMNVTWPYGSMVIGTSIFGVDKPLVVHTLSGRTLTFSAAAITRMPSLRLSATATVHTEMEFTCLGQNNEATTAADNLVAIAEVAFDDASFNNDFILTQTYSAAWGGAPWNAIKTFDGWTVDFDLQITPVTTDADGIVDYTFSNISARATARPMGITEAQLVTALRVQGASAVRGRSMQVGASDLVLTGTSLQVTLKSAQLQNSGMAFSPQNPRLGELTWVATRPFTLGVAGALFTVTPPA